MNLILLSGQLINPDYIRRIKSIKGPIVISRKLDLDSNQEPYVVYLDGGEEIMITLAELNLLWGVFGVEL